ncbi:MAG: circadian clock protein KaiC [Undibacterium sp.]|nr:circadian clock protein KaiC [Undibacterium sp.]
MPIINDGVKKTPTGIEGLDDITSGGLPCGRSTLLCGGTGTGKTLFALEFLIQGAVLYGEAGVFFSFEEDAIELCRNVDSFGFNVGTLIDENRIEIDHVQLERNQVNGPYDLDGLFIRLDLALKKVNAKRVVLDSVDMLFMALPNPVLIREEIRRLLHWLKARGLTVIITAESGITNLTRDGMEEYVSDCVILLENRVTRHATTRLLRIVKYRGSAHGSNEYPFLITEKGISVLPITALSLDLPVSEERISTGVPRLDSMLGGKGYFRGSTILVSGPPGSGKSSLAAKFAQATCAKGERCLYFSLEEPRNQIIRNMRSVGIDLQPLLDSELLQFVMTRPSLYGLEMHLAKFHQAINEFKPSTVIFDPISTLHSLEDPTALKSMLLRLVNFLKSQQITSNFVTLSGHAATPTTPDIGISSIIDTWLQLRDIETNGERNRLMLVLKSRGMSHSNQMREFTLSEHGIELSDVYTGSAGVLTGSARLGQEAQEKLIALTHKYDIEYRTLELDRKRKLKDAQIAAIEAEFNAHQAELARLTELDRQGAIQSSETNRKMSKLRQSDTFPSFDGTEK